MNEKDSNENVQRPGPDNRMLIGVLIIAAGSLLLLDKLDIFFFPSWLFSWPLILIAIGFIIGAKQRFAGMGWLILIVVGVYFFLQHHAPFGWNLHLYSFPILLILIGILVLFRSSISRGKHPEGSRRTRFNPYREGGGSASGNVPPAEAKDSSGSGEEVLDLTTILGSIKKRIISKNFKGGDVTTFFGGTELDFTQADINGQAFIDITQVFGGVSLVVPANWSVKSDLVAILGGINDKRSNVTSPGESDKVLVISGVCIFGGIEIKSY
jgi:predicted membrane protein